MQKTNHHIRFFYNRIAPVYKLIDLFLKKRKIRLVTEISNEPKGNLLDIGIGSGTHLSYYRNHTIQGIDLSEKMLDIALLRKSYTSINLQRMDGEALEFANNSFDYILITHVLSVTTNPEQMITEAKRVLKDKGKLYILNHNTPSNFLKYLDKCFQFIAKRFHFSSHFRIRNIHSLQQLQLINETSFDQFNYTKLFVYQK